eukprot:195924-Rhodomonas_salina.1
MESSPVYRRSAATSHFESPAWTAMSCVSKMRRGWRFLPWWFVSDHSFGYLEGKASQCPQHKFGRKALESKCSSKAIESSGEVQVCAGAVAGAYVLPSCGSVTYSHSSREQHATFP